MPTLIEQIRAAYPIAPFVAPYTGGLKPSGTGWLIGRCPFHQQPDDKHRQFWVNPEKGICGCFVPRCQAQQPGGQPMDVINFYARLKGITNQQAIRQLRGQLVSRT